MSYDEGLGGLRRILVGLVGVAAVPVMLMGIVAGVFGYLMWPIAVILSLYTVGDTSLGLNPANGWILLFGYGIYTFASGAFARAIVHRFVDQSNVTAVAMTLITVWGLLLVTAASCVSWRSGWL